MVELPAAVAAVVRPGWGPPVLVAVPERLLPRGAVVELRVAAVPSSRMLVAALGQSSQPACRQIEQSVDLEPAKPAGEFSLWLVGPVPFAREKSEPSQLASVSLFFGEPVVDSREGLAIE